LNIIFENSNLHPHYQNFFHADLTFIARATIEVPK
jgi:hypothetical protein